jgi:hypothetical protein
MLLTAMMVWLIACQSEPARRSQSRKYEPQGIRWGGNTMRFAGLHQVAKPVRDFVGSLIVFSCLFVAMSPVDLDYAPLPIISLLTDWSATTWSTASITADQAAIFTLKNGGTSLSADRTPLISTMMTFSLGLIRYLRRANASSWREVWREG